ncbi:MAG: hypothetical protein LBV12_03425 [Puniceicoccales bacterium]|jgi:hypothetical protein|nr:hypothetical protein [Puniceicoccales bacterium]
MSLLAQFVLWSGRVVFFIALTMALGGIAGMLLYPLGGLIFGTGELGWRGVLLLGLQHGQQWTGIWAGGLAFILCIMESRTQRMGRSKAGRG